MRALLLFGAHGQGRDDRQSDTQGCERHAVGNIRLKLLWQEMWTDKRKIEAKKIQ